MQQSLQHSVQISYLVWLIEKVSYSLANPVNQCVRVAKNIEAQQKHIHLTDTLPLRNIKENQMPVGKLLTNVYTEKKRREEGKDNLYGIMSTNLRNKILFCQKYTDAFEITKPIKKVKNKCYKKKHSR